jgi:hypothetical protein
MKTTKAWNKGNQTFGEVTAENGDVIHIRSASWEGEWAQPRAKDDRESYPPQLRPVVDGYGVAYNPRWHE